MSLDLSGITRAVGAEIHIRDVSMRLERGSVNVLLGPTRAGKTSLMRLMAGLDMPTGGTMTLDGRDITRVPVRGRNVAMVYQQFINYPALTVYENIASPLRIQKKSTRDIDEAVHTAAALMKLEAHLQKTPLQLSGGQQQRTAIARALVKKADVVLLDEPLANLDYKLREELRVELPRIFESTGAIFVYATTEPAEALLLGGKTATMAEGRVTQFGAAADVYRHPHDRETAELYSDPPMNFVEAIVASGKIKIAGQPEFAIAGALKTLADGTYVLGFRPHHLSLKVAGEGHYAFETVVAVAELSGSESFVHVDAGPSRWIALAHGVHDVLPGAPLQVSLDPDRLFVFDPSGALRAAPRRQEG